MVEHLSFTRGRPDGRVAPPSRRFRAPSTWPAALALLLAFPVVARAQVGVDTLEVVDLRFEGNDHFRSSVLREAIRTEDTHCSSPLLGPFCWVGWEWAIERRYLALPEVARDAVRIRLFYFRRGFREAAVDSLVTQSGAGARVTFRIEEGPPVVVRQVLVTGDRESADSAAVVPLPLRPGQPLSLLDLEASREQLLTGLRNRGYARAEVLAGFFIPAETPHSADVTFEVIQGPLVRYGPISVVGADDLAESTVLSLLPFREGDVYSEAQLQAGQRHVFDLDIVRHAEIVPALDSGPDSVAPLQVRINEAPPHRFRAGGGFSTFECLTVQGRWTSRNFRGGGRRLDASLRFWNMLADEFSTACTQAGTGRYGVLNYSASVDFLQPFVFSPRNSFSTRLFFERESFPDVFVRQTLGTDLLFARSIGRLSATAVFYRPQYGSFDAAEVYFCSNFLICSAEEIQAVSNANMLAPVGVQLSLDNTSPVTNPVRGWTAGIGVEVAGRFSASDYAYDRWIVEGSGLKELGRGSQRVLAARLRFGYLNPRSFGGVTQERTDLSISAPQKRFYSGGATSVRGFATGRLGPRSLQTDVRNLVPDPDRNEGFLCEPEEILDLSCNANGLEETLWTEAPNGGNVQLVGNLEYRAWLTEKLQGTLFVDFGQVWSLSEDVDLGDVEITPGFGIRYPTPIGPIRVDLAYNFRGRQPLPALTSQLAVFDPANPGEVVSVGADGTAYVIADELAPLTPPVEFGDENLFSWRRLQLHLSVGQAF